MCGPTSAQTSLAGQESGFMTQYSDAFNSRFAGQTQLLNSINSVTAPTLALGPEQTGFSPEELATYNTQALDTTGANYANAERAVGTSVAGQGDSAVESGVQQAEKAGVGTAAAGQTSSEELGITEANYAQGRSNYAQALGETNTEAQIENPTGYASLTQTAEGQSFNQQTTIAQEQAQEDAAIAGGVTSLASAAGGGFANLDSTGSSSVGEQMQNFAGGF